MIKPENYEKELKFLPCVGDGRESFIRAFSVIPSRIAGAIFRALFSRLGGAKDLSEIRLRRMGRSSLVISGEDVPLFVSVREYEMRSLFERATGGSLYSQINNVKEGFVNLGCGVRMGVCFSGALEIPSSVAIRLPIGRCDNAEKIYLAYKKALPRGIIVFSEPGGGKTTALRSLAKSVGERDRCRAVVIDERGEMNISLSNATVDIITGVSKSKGIEMAKRTMGARMIIADEIGTGEECESLLSVGRGGIPLAVSAHAGDINELCSLPAISPLIREGYFGAAVGLKRSREGFICEVYEL